MGRAILVILAAVASPLLGRAAPGYAPWTWVLWGREVAGGSLSTVAGPAFKPLPVAITTILAPLGGAAPWLWVLLARAGAIAALVLAFRLGGLLAAAAVVVTGGFAPRAAAGPARPPSLPDPPTGPLRLPSSRLPCATAAATSRRLRAIC